MSEEKKQGINLVPFKIYGVIYLVLMVLYIIGMIGRGIEITPAEWLIAAYPEGGSSVEQLKQNAVANTADFRADMNYAFDTVKNVPVLISAGDRATPEVAAEVALAIQHDQQNKITDIKKMVFPYTEMKIFRTGWFWNINWAYIFTVYNIFGMFMGLYVGLKAPVKKMLGGAAEEAAQALADAKSAKREAAELKAKYEALVQEVEQERLKLEEQMLGEQEAEKIKQKEIAAEEAKAILESVRSSVNADIEVAATKLKKDIAEHAVREAKAILSQQADEQMHKGVVDDFIAQLEKSEI